LIPQTNQYKKKRQFWSRREKKSVCLKQGIKDGIGRVKKKKGKWKAEKKEKGQGV
jgi:hypothetical protein